MKNFKIEKVNVVTFSAMEIHIAETEMTWEEAMYYAADLGEGWRLPTKRELQAYAPQLEKMGIEGPLWSGSPFSRSTTSKWIVYLGNGGTLNANKYNRLGVVCVRSL